MVDPMKKKVIIMGAAGRDYHNFNMVFRGNNDYQVVAFTQGSQNIGELSKPVFRVYPKELAGRGYPKGIPIYPESKLGQLIEKNKVDEVIFAYSDVSFNYLMDKASLVLSKGANFRLLGEETMLRSKKPVIAITGVRTGVGKSPVTRKVVQILKSFRRNPVVIRHPMPYGDLKKQEVQRFEKLEDLREQKCTIEEMEEYGPLLASETVVYAGVDFGKILKRAEKEADIIVWDGGNNDIPFIKPDLWIVIADARRAGHEMTYYPGAVNFRAADVVIVNKAEISDPRDVESIINNARMINPEATIIKSAMPLIIDNPEMIRGKRVLAVEDGPTITHGGMPDGAGAMAVKNNGGYLVNPRNTAIGSIKHVYVEYPHIGAVLPAMGYSPEQMSELEETINRTDCDLVVLGTPIDLSKFMNIQKPVIRVRYDVRELTKPNLEDILRKFNKK